MMLLIHKPLQDLYRWLHTVSKSLRRLSRTCTGFTILYLAILVIWVILKNLDALLTQGIFSRQ